MSSPQLPCCEVGWSVTYGSGSENSERAPDRGSSEKLCQKLWALFWPSGLASGSFALKNARKAFSITLVPPLVEQLPVHDQLDPLI